MRLHPKRVAMDRSQSVVNIPGNVYDKYNTRNIIARLMMQKFIAAFDDLVERTAAETAYEVGCGEGFLSCRLLGRGLAVRGSDLEHSVVAEANQAARQAGYGEPFAVSSVYDLNPGEASADLVVCCEVLEHVSNPDSALRVLAQLAQPYLIVSVPREPIWRLLNLVRGAYLTSLGNTPGHIQHWTARRFKCLLQAHFDIIEIRQPLPWTMALCRVP